MLGAYFLGENFAGDDQPEPAPTNGVLYDEDNQVTEIMFVLAPG